MQQAFPADSPRAKQPIISLRGREDSNPPSVTGGLIPEAILPMVDSSESVSGYSVQLVAEADLPTRFGDFRVYGFRGTGPRGDQDLVVVARGDLRAEGCVPLLRIHSQCLTGEVFGSLRCDCGPQLALALSRIAKAEEGLFIYDPQEGRGIGLLNKLKAYQLQDEGADTVEANHRLGFDADEREYGFSVAVLRHFGLSRVRMLSNNPAKIRALESEGIRVEERVACDPDAGDLAASYLKTKREKLGHMV